MILVPDIELIEIFFFGQNKSTFIRDEKVTSTKATKVLRKPVLSHRVLRATTCSDYYKRIIP